MPRFTKTRCHIKDMDIVFPGVWIFFCSLSDLVTALCQSHLVLSALSVKIAPFARAENLIFASFFKNAVTWRDGGNQGYHLKVTLEAH